MNDIQLSRAQRRQIKKLAEKVDLVTQTDRRFFERHPQRCHRVRVMSQPEIAQNEILIGDMALPASEQHFVVIRNLAPGVRIRLSIVGPRDAETDLTEQQALKIYERVNTDHTKTIEAQMRQAAEARS